MSLKFTEMLSSGTQDEPEAHRDSPQHSGLKSCIHVLPSMEALSSGVCMSKHPTVSFVKCHLSLFEFFSNLLKKSILLS